MKDRKLEEQFNEYFEGVQIPEGLAEDAKKHVSAKPRISNRIIKYCSIASAVILCCALTIVGLARSGIFGFKQDEQAPNGTAPALYYDSELTRKDFDPYSASKADPSLKFLENLALYGNAHVEAEEYLFGDGERAHVKADVTYIDGARYDAEIRVEFADKTYSPVNGYKDGTEGSFMGHSYYLTVETAENGEPVNKLYLEKGEIKYYCYVTSSDGEAYLKCLQLIFGR